MTTTEITEMYLKPTIWFALFLIYGMSVLIVILATAYSLVIIGSEICIINDINNPYLSEMAFNYGFKFLIGVWIVFIFYTCLFGFSNILKPAKNKGIRNWFLKDKDVSQKDNGGKDS